MVCRTLLCTLMICCALCAQAQGTAPHTGTPHGATADTIVTHYASALDSLASVARERTYADDGTFSNPYYYMLFGGSPLFTPDLTRSFHAEGKHPSGPLAAHAEQVVSHSGLTLLHAYSHRPSTARYIATPAQPKATANAENPLPESEVSALYEPVPSIAPALIGDDQPLSLVVHRPNFWTLKTNLAIQFMQTYVSENWYKGGESNLSLLANLIFEANYDNKSRLTFDNKLEMKLGFQTSRSDSEHKLKTNTDLLRLTNKVGYKAVKHWYYTAMLQTWTQFYRGYKPNDPMVYSDLASPLESVLSLGMDYKAERKHFQLTATISPLAADLKYCDRLTLSPSFGIASGHHARWSIGSNITATTAWTITPNIAWNSRLYYFTDYTRTQVEWENTITIKANRYLSTKLFLYPRFDDGVARMADHSYFQFNEYFSLGLDITL